MTNLLGIDALSLEVYRTLYREQSWGVAEIAAHLGVSEDDVRHRLDVLVEAKLLRASVERTGGLRAVDPEFGLALVADQARAELERRQRELDEGRRRIEAFLDGVMRTSASSSSSSEEEELVGLDAVQTRREAMVRRTERELLGFAPGVEASLEVLGATARLESEALARGVVARTVVETAALEDAVTRTHLVHQVSHGALIRSVPALPMPLLVCDGKEALLPLQPNDVGAGAVHVRQEGAVTALAALFEAYWAVAVPVAEAVAEPQSAEYLAWSEEARHDELLALLASGATDAMVARALGMSERSVRRLLTGLWDELGAVTRFQAGVNAVRVGLL